MPARWRPVHTSDAQGVELRPFENGGGRSRTFNYQRGGMELAAAVVGGGFEEVVALNNDDGELFDWLNGR